jgi:hypothetical protein
MNITNIFADIDEPSTGYGAFVSYGLDEDDDMDFVGRYKVNRLIKNNEFDSEDSLKSAIVDALVKTYPNKKITFDYYFNNNDEIVKRYDESA